MPFMKLETIPRDARIPQASVSYERSKRKGKAGGPLPKLIIAIPTTLAGLCKRDRFQLDIGTGADTGRARITGLAKGCAGSNAPGVMMKNSLVIRFGVVPTLGTDAAAKEYCAVRKIDDNSWEIDLPAWFRVEQPARSSKAA